MPELSDLLAPPVAQNLRAFHPYTYRRLGQIVEHKTRFVHYTSASVGIEILKTKTLWLRQASCMNDYSEVDHGLRCLKAAYDGPHGQRLRKFIDGKYPGLTNEVAKKFDEWQHGLRYETFVLSLSEHAGRGAENEDDYGRLSMWRAYGRGVGVALVIRQEAFWPANFGLGLYSAPVAYLSDSAFAEELGIVATSLEANAAYLDQLGRDGVLNAILYAFAAAAIATKHPGFGEEREWRVVRSPLMHDPLPLLRETVTVGGVPQEIIKLKLENNAANGIVGITVPEILERVIIGPTEYPIPIYKAYIKALKAHGISEPSKMVKMSLLPLRAASL